VTWELPSVISHFEVLLIWTFGYDGHWLASVELFVVLIAPFHASLHCRIVIGHNAFKVAVPHKAIVIDSKASASIAPELSS